MELDPLGQQLEAVSDIYAARFGVERDALWRLAKMAEELGEVNAAYLSATGRGKARGGDARRALEDETADLLATVILFARAEGIDLEAALTRKWLAHLTK